MNKHLQRGAIAAAGLLVIFIILATSHRMEHPKRVQAAAEAGVQPIATPPVFPPNSLTANRRLHASEEYTGAQTRAGETDPDLIGVKEALRNYRSHFGENPVGNNPEITKALMGENAQRAQFAASDLKIKAGQMVDHWDHPYFFHQLSRAEMEIRSAGPDGIMWTKDDEILR